MSITNIRKRQLKWEAIDSAFNRMEYWEELPPYFEVSSHKAIGGDDLLSYIQDHNKQYTKNL